MITQIIQTQANQSLESKIQYLEKLLNLSNFTITGISALLILGAFFSIYNHIKIQKEFHKKINQSKRQRKRLAEIEKSNDIRSLILSEFPFDNFAEMILSTVQKGPIKENLKEQINEISVKKSLYTLFSDFSTYGDKFTKKSAALYTLNAKATDRLTLNILEKYIEIEKNIDLKKIAIKAKESTTKRLSD